MTRLIIVIICALTLSCFCANAQQTAPKREVRAVWLTTIGGLDWPRTKAHDSESVERQKKELTDILDKLHAANFNTVILQTRIRSTVIYPSRIETWDDCLTGHAGKNPGYDPLQFAIEECHKRKLELHAWVVAFPGNNNAQAKALGTKAMQRRLPSLCIKANDFWMLNPGMPGTAEYLSDICTEIVKNYDVDGINLDYIRYPEKEIKFSDSKTYKKYSHGESLSSWRRNNVTNCVKTIYNDVKKIKPWVRVSCSPVGKFDDVSRFSSRGWNAFTTVFQDAQGWLRDGIMDMLVPMMYFQGDHFYPFAQDWMENAYGRIVVPGLGAYMLAKEIKDWPLETIVRENYVLRQMQAGGQAYFRSRFVTENTKGLYDFLKETFYATPAFTPALSWQKEELPAQPTFPTLSMNGLETLLTWNQASEDKVTYNIYHSYSYPVDIENIENLMVSGLTRTNYAIQLPLPETLLPYFVVTTMDRYGNESKPTAFNRPLVASETECAGLLQLNKNLLILPPKNREEYVMITDLSERVVKTLAYQETIDISFLKPGYYTVRTLESKGKYHCLGKILKREK